MNYHEIKIDTKIKSTLISYDIKDTDLYIGTNDVETYIDEKDNQTPAGRDTLTNVGVNILFTEFEEDEK
jgi:hypothetical protein